MIRAGKGPFGNVKAGGMHIHHVVPGVVLSVVGGFGAVASGQHGFGAGLCAVLFGMGAGLVLDEFALILHLDDVYWTEAGRQSVEVVVLTAALVGLVLLGFLPFGVNDLSDEDVQNRGGAMLSVGVNFLFALVALSKGKARMAVFGVIIPFVALVGAHPPGPPRLALGEALLPPPPARPLPLGPARLPSRPPLGRPRRRVQDLIGGKPDPTPTGTPAVRR